MEMVKTETKKEEEGKEDQDEENVTYFVFMSVLNRTLEECRNLILVVAQSHPFVYRSLGLLISNFFLKNIFVSRYKSSLKFDPFSQVGK